jgi:hypothetical protein
MRKTLAIGAVCALLFMLGATAVAQEDPKGSSSSPSFEDLQKDVKSVGTIEVGVSSTAMVISWQGIQLGKNVSTWLREKVDGLDGNGRDGNISQDEADSAQVMISEFVKREFDVYAHQEGMTGHLLIDQANPKGAEVNSLVADGIVGPVSSDKDISLSFVTTIGFPTRAADVHTVKLDMGKYYFNSVNESSAKQLVGDFSLTIKGTDGWKIDGASVQPGCAADKFKDGSLVFKADDVNCFTGRSGVLLAFSVAGGADHSAIPGFGAGLWILGLLAGVVAIRRGQ